MRSKQTNYESESDPESEYGESVYSSSSEDYDSYSDSSSDSDSDNEINFEKLKNNRKRPRTVIKNYYYRDNTNNSRGSTIWFLIPILGGVGFYLYKNKFFDKTIVKKEDKPQVIRNPNKWF